MTSPVTPPFGLDCTAANAAERIDVAGHESRRLALSGHVARVRGPACTGAHVSAATEM